MEGRIWMKEKEMKNVNGEVEWEGSIGEERVNRMGCSSEILRLTQGCPYFPVEMGCRQEEG